MWNNKIIIVIPSSYYRIITASQGGRYSTIRILGWEGTHYLIFKIIIIIDRFQHSMEIQYKQMGSIEGMNMVDIIIIMN